MNILKLSLFLCLLTIARDCKAQHPGNSADTILKAALKKAEAENKNILLIFEASWCSWCAKMDKSINDSACKKYFMDQYVISHLRLFENPEKKQFENRGALALLKKYKGETAGLPFWVILNKNGELVADSFMKNPDGSLANIGCPTSAIEVNAFIQVLKTTTSLGEASLLLINKVFRKNALNYPDK